MFKSIATATLILAPLPLLAEGDWQDCNFETNTGRLAISYEVIGPEACVDFCKEIDGCTAWLYTPHTFNPDTAPGACGLYAEASGTRPPNETAPTQYCGWVE